MLTNTLTLRICPSMPPSTPPSIHPSSFHHVNLYTFLISIHPLIHLSVYLSICPSIYHPSFSQSIMLSTNLFIYPSNCPFICPCVCPYLHLSIHPSIHLSFHPSIYPSIQSEMLYWSFLSINHGSCPLKTWSSIFILVYIVNGISFLSLTLPYITVHEGRFVMNMCMNIKYPWCYQRCRETERKEERHLRQWKNDNESCLRCNGKLKMRVALGGISNPRHSVVQTDALPTELPR